MSLMLFAEYAIGAFSTCIVAWKLATGKGLNTFVPGFAMLWFTGMALQFTSDNRKGLWVPAANPRSPTSTSLWSACNTSRSHCTSPGCCSGCRSCS